MGTHNRNMTYAKAEELWGTVLKRPTRKKMALVSIDILSNEAIYVIKTDLQYEHIALRFRKAGGHYVSARRVWYTDEVKVTVSRFYPPAKIFTSEDFDKLIKEFASQRSNHR